MKIGVSASTDSLTPRMLRVVSPRMISASAGSFTGSQCGGRKLNSASPAAAMEVVMVST